MLIEQKHLESFTEETFPSFPCPRCNSSLHPVKDGICVYESAESRIQHELGALDVTEGAGIFTAILKCASPQCMEFVAVCGRSNPGTEWNSDGREELLDYLRPSYFYPTVSLFKIPSQCPQTTTESLHSAFSLFWSDPPASGNALRKAVESLLDFIGIERATAGGGKLSLHHRIERFATSSPNLGHFLMAIKWRGNAGSHADESTRMDIFEALKLFHHFCEELFERRTETLEGLARKINADKK